MARLNASDVLDEAKRVAVAAQAPIVQHGQFYLAGGTALALHLGHRHSRDVDWFTARSFDGPRLADALSKLPLKPTTIVQVQPDTVRVLYGNLEASFIRYSVFTAHPTTMEVSGVKLPVADLETIAAMKAAAVINRGAKRDFIDIHALVREPGWSMDRFVDVAEGKLGVARGQLRLGLTYFADADKQELPAGTSVVWNDVKRDLFRDVVAAFDRKRGPEIDR